MKKVVTLLFKILEKILKNIKNLNNEFTRKNNTKI